MSETPEEAAERMRRWMKTRQAVPNRRLQEPRGPNPEPTAITPPPSTWTAAWQAALAYDPDKPLDKAKPAPQVDAHGKTQE